MLELSGNPALSNPYEEIKLPDPKGPKFRKFLPLIVLFTLFILLIPLTLFLSTVKRVNTSREKSKVVPAAVSPTADIIWKSSVIKSPPAVNPSSWTLYSDTPNKLSFKYPSGLLLVDYKKTTPDQYDVYFVSSLSQKKEMENCLAQKTSSCESFSLALRFKSLPMKANGDLSLFLKNELDENSSDFTPVTIAGSHALERQLVQGEIKNNIYILRKTSVFSIFALSAISPEKNMALYQKILSTLEFTE